ncbi:3,4-dihydroxy-2-butanone-4-phosphate synthase [Nocardia sp. NPDC088792]|uniref:3,4-dihydroxy-2-butanone-4-phosphate synthase n=1 Tax=Nocardia sp. NPDC088792 TaxID=3364332 RepID=UPI0037F4A0A2
MGVERALAELADGRCVLVVDDEDQANGGDLLAAASLVTAGVMAFLVRHTSGLIGVALPAGECDRLMLPPMVFRNEHPRRTSYAVTVDAAEGISTGISAADRARTARVLAAASTEPDELCRPGHVLPIRARSGGVLERRGHTEAAVDLTRLAGLAPAGVIGQLVSPVRTAAMADRNDLRIFAGVHDIAMVTIGEVAEFLGCANNPLPAVARA